jgi:ATP-binding cassette subfamily B protein
MSKVFWWLIEATFFLRLNAKLANLDIATLEDPSKNDLFAKVRENGVWRIQNFVERQFYVAQNVLEVCVAAAILVAAEWWVLPVVVVTAVPSLLVEMRYGREVWGIHSAGAQTRRHFWEYNRHFTSIASLIEMKIFRSAAFLYGRMDQLLRTFRSAEQKNERAKLLRSVAALSVAQLGAGAAIIGLATAVIHGDIKVGTFVFFLATLGQLRQSLSGLFNNVARQYEDNLFVDDIFTVLDLPPHLPQTTSPTKLKATTPDIAFENVGFTYPDSDTPALHDVNLNVPAGTKVAIVGENGAGKSTLIKLLCRFYDPTEGKVIVNGENLNSLDQTAWHGRLGALFQGFPEYDLPVREAIGISNINVKPTDKLVKAAAERSGAAEFIERWPNGYDQQLGKRFDNGREPSHGQWQKIALARVFFRDSQVIILDEPTASIDAEAEARIFEQLEQLPNDRTVFLISHRFSTVRNADLICVVDRGTITEQGSHDELVALGGTYARLFNLQAAGYQ